MRCHCTQKRPAKGHRLKSHTESHEPHYWIHRCVASKGQALDCGFVMSRLHAAHSAEFPRAGKPSPVTMRCQVCHRSWTSSVPAMKLHFMRAPWVIWGASTPSEQTQAACLPIILQQGQVTAQDVSKGCTLSTHATRMYCDLYTCDHRMLTKPTVGAAH